jgi:hypothetical protein
VLVCIIVFLHRMILLSCTLGVLTVLLLYRDHCRYKQLMSQDLTIFALSDSSARLELNRLGFDRFRIFSNRWFVILQMRNEQTTRNMMLVADRFRTINEYLGFRYQIINLCRNQHAA